MKWDEQQKASATKITGLCIAVFAVFALLSSVSYLFTWKADQSILTDPAGMGLDVPVSNMAGKLGYKLGYLLVCRWFGLGSFALFVILAAISVRLLLRRWHYSLLKTTLVALSGAFVASLILSFVAGIFGPDTLFGGGLGGQCGAFMVSWGKDLIGSIATFCVILLLLVCWLFLSSRRFTEWVASLGTAADAESDEDQPELDAELASGPGTLAAWRSRLAGKGENVVAAAGSESGRAVVSESVGAAFGSPIAGGEGSPRAGQPASGTSLSAVGRPSVDGASPLVKATEAEVSTTAAGFETSKAHAATSNMGESGKAHTATPNPAAGQPVTDMEVIEGDGFSTEIDKPLPRIDMRQEEVPNYKFPSLEILEEHAAARREVSTEELTRNNNKIRAALANYHIQVVDVKAVVGPTVTLYKVYPAPGVRIAEIKKLQEDIAMSLNARGVRVVTLEDSVGIEVANDNASIVPLRAMLNDKAFRESKAELPVAIGYTITQKVKVFDLADTPHLLVAGATKQGKSVGLNVIVASLLYSKHPSEMKMVFIDPKMVEFSAYAQLLKHYLAVLPDAGDEEEERSNAIVKKPKEAEKILRSLCIEMDERYEMLSKAYVNNIKLYNEKYKDRKLRPDHGHRFLPYMVVVIDEYADLTMSVGGSAESRAMSKSIQNSIIRLAQKGRAAGIHVILATQRPSVDVISGVIKTNFPTRIAFRVAARTDSQTILDQPGAEKLIGKGDMLYYAGIETERIQCAFISNDEINAITKYVGDQTGFKKCYNTPYYLPAPAPAEGEAGGATIDMTNLDDRFEEAARMVVMTQRGSTSDLQRKLGMGYAKAGRVMDQLEAAGIVGPQEGSKPRQVLITDFDSLDEILRAFKKS